MGKSSTPAPMPDLAGIMAAQTAANQSQWQQETAQEQLDWARNEYQTNKGKIEPIVDRMVSNMDAQSDFARSEQDFYQSNYQPLEKEFIDEARSWASPERQEMNAASAAADVAQQFDGARRAALQNLMDYGIDPSAPRYASSDLLSKLGQAQATAAAENMARRNTELQGLQLQKDAIGFGRTYAPNINAGYNGANAAGGAAVGAINQTQSTGAQMMGTGPQWAGTGNQALGIYANATDSTYDNYMNGYQIQNQPQSGGWGSALGLLGGATMGPALGSFGRAAGTAAAAAMFAEGGAVPPMASPTAGAAVDDVPARVNVGEFIMPKEAVSWFGEKAMHDMILKAQKERMQFEQQSGAVPGVMPARPEAPALVSGPKQALALPAR